MYIKYLSCLLLSYVMIVTACADSSVVGRIEDFDGNPKPFTLKLEDDSSKIVPAAYMLIRGQKKVDIGFLTELQTNDLLIVNDDQHFLQIKLADNSLVKVTATQSPYLVTSKGEIPNIGVNLKNWFVGLTERHQEEVEATIISTKGGSNQPPIMPLLEKTTKVLVAGKRALSLTWQKGKPAYQIILKQSEKVLFETSAKDREFQLSELEFMPGEYQLLLSDGEQRQVTSSFTVVEELPVYPPELTDESLASLSESARLTVQALWLANQEDGKWLFEAYQQVAEVSKDNHFAKVLKDALEKGIVLKPSEFSS